MARRLVALLGVALLAAELGVVAGPARRAEALGQREPALDEVVIVVDTAGAVVGPLLATRAGAGQVLVRADGRAVQLLVGRDQLASEAPAQFETANCTGPPLIEHPPAMSTPPVVERATLGSLGEVLVPSGDPQSLVIRSERHTLFFLDCVTLGPPEPRSVRSTVVLPVGPYVPPFRVQLAAGALLAPGPGPLEAGEGAAARQPSTFPFVALDATGQPLGPVLGVPDPEVITIWLRRGGRDFVGALTPGGAIWPFLQDDVGQAFFESSDCTGPALIANEGLDDLGIHPLFEAAAGGPGGVLLGADGPEDLKTVGSRWDVSVPGCDPTSLFSLLVAPTVTVLDPTTLPLPLRLR